ncbi:MAG: hypothetical protein JNL10_13515 [Verrucomicrobiales bacterium]|nr:hypothetical protein [Verrucomicrobiales bacterium]
MSPSLAFHLVLGFGAGGMFIAACSRVAERLGPRLGGLLTGMPSTVVVTFLFIGYTDSRQRVVEECTFVPVALALNCVLLATFGWLASRRVVLALPAAVGVWVLLAAAAVRWIPRRMDAGLLLLAVTYVVAWSSLPRGAGAGCHPSTLSSPARMTLRALVGGAMVALGIWLGSSSGPFLAGISSSFPVAGVSTLGLVSWYRGTPFAAEMVRPMMTSGSVTILVYALAVRITYPGAGVALGTLLALLASTAAAGLLYLLQNARNTRAPSPCPPIPPAAGR